MKAAGWCMILLLSAIHLPAQVPTKEIDFERLIDELLPLQDLEMNYEDIYENWMQLLSNPLDLNRATPAQLQALYLLSDQQIAALIRHREENGSFLSVYELQVVPGFSQEVIERLMHFVRVGNTSRLQEVWMPSAGYVLSRWERGLEKRQGSLSTDSTTRFVGSPNKLYQRIRLQKPQAYTAGITAEKDAGEEFRFSGSQYGFDFTSGHLQAQNLGPVKVLTLGDFQAQFGQGVILGGGFGLGKGGETILTARRSTLGFLPYTSVLESGFFRGAGITAEVSRNVFLHAMYSHNLRDGRLAGDSLQLIVTSLPLAGLHRTPAEQALRRTVSEINQAAILQYQLKHLDAGIIWHHSRFGEAISRNPNRYNQFAFNGRQNENIGAFLSYNYKNFSLFAEHGYTRGRGHGTVAGILGNLSEGLAVAIHLRNFQRDFITLYSNAFCEGTLPQNELGLYWGFRYTLNKRVALQGYIDQFRFPWLRFRAYAPGTGQELLARINWTPSKKVSVFVQYRNEQKDRNTTADHPIYQAIPGRRRNLWLNADYGEGVFRFKSRLQWSSFSIAAQKTTGLVLLQDISYKSRRVGVTMRYALFDTDDFDNRQYAYERDVWLAFSLPALAGRGIRQYAMLQYDLTRRCTIWLRWSVTRYTDRTTISSGVNQISGPVQNDFKIQVRFGF